MDQRESSSCIGITFLWIAVIIVILNNHPNSEPLQQIDLITPINDFIKAYESLGMSGILLLILLFVGLEVKLYQKRMYAPLILLAMIAVGLVMWKFEGIDMRIMLPIYHGTNMTGH